MHLVCRARMTRYDIILTLVHRDCFLTLSSCPDDGSRLYESDLAKKALNILRIHQVGRLLPNRHKDTIRISRPEPCWTLLPQKRVSNCENYAAVTSPEQGIP